MGRFSLTVAIVNRSMANQLWPGEDPIGKRITFGNPAQPDTMWLSIVGVVGDARRPCRSAGGAALRMTDESELVDRTCS